MSKGNKVSSQPSDLQIRQILARETTNPAHRQAIPADRVAECAAFVAGYTGSFTPPTSELPH